MRVGIVVPHIFMQDVVLPHVIFSPGKLALDLADGLGALGAEVRLYTPGKVTTSAQNITADMTYFEQELNARGDSYLDLMKKHPLTFVSLARQVQAEIIARAFADANADQLDVVHIYTNEEDIALPFAQFCAKPVVFTHHDPFSLLVRYKNNFPKYCHLNWISLSLAQRATMPSNTHWVANIYHGLEENVFAPNYDPSGEYVLFLGRIIQPKGVHLAIAAVKQYNSHLPPGTPMLKLKIVGKHYAGLSKDTYWCDQVAPYIDGSEIEYVGFVQDSAQKQALLGNARALLMPSLFDEPFGMVAIEALACATPVIGLDSGAISEIVKDSKTGYVVPNTRRGNTAHDEIMIAALAKAIAALDAIDRQDCRNDFAKRFTRARMCKDHFETYLRLSTQGAAAVAVQR